MRELLAIAQVRDISVEWRPGMGDWLRGVYEHGVRTITLNSTMNIEQQRFALAHELGHAWHEHVLDGTDPHADLEAERLADEHAASLLVDPDQYARAEALHGPHPGALADELDVHPDVVVVFQRVLRRVRPVAYATPWGRAPWLANRGRDIA